MTGSDIKQNKVGKQCVLGKNLCDKKSRKLR